MLARLLVIVDCFFVIDDLTALPQITVCSPSKAPIWLKDLLCYRLNLISRYKKNSSSTIREKESISVCRLLYKFLFTLELSIDYRGFYIINIVQYQHRLTM